VADCVRRLATQWGYVVRETPDGNLLVGRQVAHQNPKLMLLSHMDHPALKILNVSGKVARVGVMGGLPLDQLVGAQFLFVSGDDKTTGRVRRKLKTQWMGQPEFEVHLKKEIASGGFATLDVPSPQWRGDRLSARAIDNLANVAGLLCLLWSERHNRRSRLLCVFTRAEEVGMVGTSALIHRNTLSKKIPLIVLEASSAIGGKVAIGGGPVIRVGDRVATYDPSIDLWLQDVVAKLSAHNKKLQSQRALLAGGRCEATVFFAHGYRVGGLALPLGNYHNRGARRLETEFISWKDFVGLQELLQQILKHPFSEKQLRRHQQWGFVHYYNRWKSKLRA